VQLQASVYQTVVALAAANPTNSDWLQGLHRGGKSASCVNAKSHLSYTLALSPVPPTHWRTSSYSDRLPLSSAALSALRCDRDTPLRRAVWLADTAWSVYRPSAKPFALRQEQEEVMEPNSWRLTTGIMLIKFFITRGLADKVKLFNLFSKWRQ